MNKIFKTSALALALSTFSGCGESPDVAKMKSGLIKSGFTATQATSYAEMMAKDVDGEHYNYMAEMMNAGLTERAAYGKTRRRFGAEFNMSAVKKAKEASTNK